MKNLLSNIICGSNKDMIKLCLNGAEIRDIPENATVVCKNGIEVKENYYSGEGGIYLEKEEEYIYSNLLFTELTSYCQVPVVKDKFRDKVFNAIKGLFK